jgi:hypothetical protein
MFIVYFRRVGTNYHILHITSNSANLNNVATSWASLSAVIETCLYVPLKFYTT